MEVGKMHLIIALGLGILTGYALSWNHTLAYLWGIMVGAFFIDSRELWRILKMLPALLQRNKDT